MSKTSKKLAEAMVRRRWDEAYQALDALQEEAETFSDKDLQAEYDEVAGALDNLLAAAGIWMGDR